MEHFCTLPFYFDSAFFLHYAVPVRKLGFA